MVPGSCNNSNAADPRQIVHWQVSVAFVLVLVPADKGAAFLLHDCFVGSLVLDSAL